MGTVLAEPPVQVGSRAEPPSGKEEGMPQSTSAPQKSTEFPLYAWNPITASPHPKKPWSMVGSEAVTTWRS